MIITNTTIILKKSGYPGTIILVSNMMNKYEQKYGNEKKSLDFTLGTLQLTYHLVKL